VTRRDSADLGADAEIAPPGWDAATVEPPGGHILQSVAWARHRAASGWTPLFHVAGEARTLALTRPWPLLGGGSAYVPRGPVPVVDGRIVAARLLALAEALERRGIDVVAADPEVPAADPGYGPAIRAAGWRPIEEIQPSRHRLALPIEPSSDELAAFGAIAKSTRQRIRAAEKARTVVLRHDAMTGANGVGEGFAPPTEPSAAAFDRFAGLLRSTGRRRRFSFGPTAEFTTWWAAALAAGHLVHLEARVDDEPLAGLLLYRHGRRLTTAHSADRAELRRAHPGVLHLLRWRALQLAIREGCLELDLGGADVAGARREPREGEPAYGLYEHKRSFGATWLELAGAHERSIRPWRYAAGRIASRASRAVGR
jgi:lipid II:glycine glycyltransferase (peptidoglycan interpeptide bridge formation enzyme)